MEMKIATLQKCGVVNFIADAAAIECNPIL